MRTEEPRPIRLSEYTPPAWRIARTDLIFDLRPTATKVTARLALEAQGAPQPLTLNGERLKLVSLAADGRTLAPEAYVLTDETLTLTGLPKRCTLTVVTEIDPAGNTALEGLYLSNGIFCTQCESEGFRRITYFLDRPDAMSVYSVRIEADKASCPVLLSNGNPGATGDLPGGRHFAEWRDPFPKPSYLFALVAGDLGVIRDTFVTMSGRRVALAVYCDKGNEDRCVHALESLKRSMRWDEERFGREYDLDVFNIVAVSAFNFGAMENKGLNIFNDKLVYASAETATDTDYEMIEAVVAHEYFHNWTGNRITCRDWFQLCLKEGLTVYRDQEYSADVGSRPVKLISEVKTLRLRQFPEDAGPLAHPVRPESYITIDNFYTATVYEKGAEVVRMIATLLGPDGFRKGMDAYFDANDGTAATVEDFVSAFERAAGADLSQFRRWYAQAGTPQVTASGVYDAAAQTYTLTLTQRTPPTPGQPEKLPLHMPVRIGLVGADGRDLPLQLLGEPAPRGTTRVLELKEARQDFVFVNVAERPVLSAGRGFSAPVKLSADLTPRERAHLIAFDSDPFNRWEAGQQYATALVLKAIDPKRANAPESVADFVESWGKLLADSALDPAFKALALTLPSELDLAQAADVVEPDKIHASRRDLLRAIARAHGPAIRKAYDGLASREPYAPTPDQSGRRALRNALLRILASLDTRETQALAAAHYRSASNMTDMVAGLSVLADAGTPEAAAAFADFYERYKDTPLVIDKWMGLQAMSARPDTRDRVTALMRHPAFAMTNPNRVRSLVGAFVFNNPLHFHAADGGGYRLVADAVLALDKINPQVAARLLTGFDSWRRYDAARQSVMRAELERIRGTAGLSPNVFEIVSKTLG